MTIFAAPALHSDTLYPVQYLRAAASLVVMYFHVSILSQETWGLDPEVVDHIGAAGVDLFFIISGFIMAMIVDRPGAFDGREYWIRRIARVAPAYWIITIFVFVLAALVPSLFHSTTADVPQLITSLLFLAVDTGSGSAIPMLVVGWTLNYEIFFYAIVAVTAGLFSDRRLWGASAVLICLAAVGIATNPANETLAFYTDPILLEFVFGIAVYAVWRRVPGSQLVSLAIFASGIVLLAAQWEKPLVDWRAFYWGVPAAAVLYGGLGGLRFRTPLLARLGDWSYALYLTHLFVVTFYIKFAIPAAPLDQLPWQVHYLIMTVTAFAVAGVYYSFVERPLSRWTLRKLSRRPVAALAASTTVNHPAG